MGTEQSMPTGPDLALGIPVDYVPDGHMLAGHVGDDAVLLARHGDEFFAIGATCAHYGGPLAEGLMVEDRAPTSMTTASRKPSKICPSSKKLYRDQR
jgi:hypothetical protein